MAEVTPGWQCKYCKKRFQNERIFLKHECTQMVRSREIQTQEGRMAYGLYKHWLEKQRRKAPEIETFLTSNYYTSFLKFAEYARSIGLPDPLKYVEIMVDAKIAPALWRRQEAYQMVLEHLDKKSDPMDQVSTTIETLITLSEGFEVKFGEVFKKLTAGEVLELIHQRRLSPLFLFCSKSFKQWVSMLHEGERIALMKGINVDYWALKMEKAPDLVKKVKDVVEELET